MDVAVEPDHENPLAWVSALIGVILHIEQLPGFDRNHNSLKAELPFGHELLVFFRAPCEGLHEASLAILSA